MSSSKIELLAIFFGFWLTLAGSQTAFAKDAANLSVRVGYFNLAQVRTSYPAAAGVEEMKEESINQLRQYADEGNRKLEKARQEKKSPEEIQKMLKDLQAEVNAKEKAYADLLQMANARAAEDIRQAVNAVCQEKNLDTAVDIAGLFTGAQRIIDGGVDITDAVIKKLTTPVSTPAGTAPGRQ